MAYPLSFIKIDIIGDCFDSAEIWNTGLKLRLDPELIPTNDSLQPAAEKVASAWESFFTGTEGVAGTGFSTRYRTLEVKASLVGTDGRVVGNTYTHFYPDPITGPRGGDVPLAQAAVVGTFRSEIQRGPGSTGRMYLPGIAYEVESDGLMAEDATRDNANNFNAFINDINILPPLEFNGFTVILSSPVGDGVQRDVQMTGIDRKVDTQRRRANALTSDVFSNEVLFE